MTTPASFDRIARAYDATRAVPPEAQAAIAAGIAALVPGPERHLLDVGVGTGRIAVPVSARGVRVTGVDVATEMLTVLREKRSGIRVVVADAARLPFARATFGAVLFVHVLHLVDPGQVLAEAARVLHERGVVLRGRTDYADGARTAFARLVDTVANELLGTPPPPREWNAARNAAFTAFAAAVGGTVEDRVLARWTEATTGEKLLDALATRLFSSSWHIPETAMPAVLAEVRARAAALLGGLERTITVDATFTLGVVRLPSV